VLEENIRRFAAVLARESGRGLCSTLRHFERENHLSVCLPSMYYGLLYVWEAYSLPVKEILDRPAELGAHFARLSRCLGVDMRPSGALAEFLGQLSLYQIQDPDKAIAFFKLNVSQFSRSAGAYGQLAEAYAAKGETALAVESYERALELDPTSQQAAVRLQQLRHQQSSE
jgi:tetratricopeptide (TPR) repeat protein